MVSRLEAARSDRRRNSSADSRLSERRKKIVPHASRERGFVQKAETVPCQSKLRSSTHQARQPASKSSRSELTARATISHRAILSPDSSSAVRRSPAPPARPRSFAYDSEAIQDRSEEQTSELQPRVE